MDQTPTTDVLQWLQKLSEVSFGTLIALILFGGFWEIWVWGRYHRARIAELHALNAKLEAEKNEWKSMALGMLEPVEESLKKGKRG